jgi:hypothetical protein
VVNGGSILRTSIPSEDNVTQLREGNQGGTDLLERTDRVRNREEDEKNEELNLRTADLLDQEMSKRLGKFVGGHITNRMFEIPPPQGSSRSSDLTFDRWYWEQNLLVHFFSQPFNDTDRASNEADITKRRAFCNERGLKFLAVVGGSVTPQELNGLFDGTEVQDETQPGPLPNTPEKLTPGVDEPDTKPEENNPAYIPPDPDPDPEVIEEEEEPEGE